MAGKKDKISKASDAARAAGSNRYVQRVLEDEDLRESVRAAYESARKVHGRMSDGKPATRALLEDRRLQYELVKAAHALKEVSEALKEPPKKQRRRVGLTRKLLVLSFAGVLALALSESLRAKVLDLLFGAEEEFDYSSTTTPAQDAPSPAGASSA